MTFRPISPPYAATSPITLALALALGCMPRVGGEGAEREREGVEREQVREDVTEERDGEPVAGRAGEHAAFGERVAERAAMVDSQIASRGVDDPAVLSAMRQVPRHAFVPEAYRDRAYGDHPLPIGEGQTISQPVIVAEMSALAEVGPGDTVLEIGTGSGYHAAVLAELGATVYTIEIVEPLALEATVRLADLGYGNVHVRHGDGYVGWPEHAPFDAVVVTAAPPEVPRPLLDQLAIGGRLVIPVGGDEQFLEVHVRTDDGFTRQQVYPVRFVPMTGEAQQAR